MGGRIIRRGSMSKKSVTECRCDRCKRVWYEDAGKPGQDNKLELSAIFGDDVINVALDSLCEGCSKTVRSLVESIRKVMEKAAPIRKAKKKEKTADAGTTPTPTAAAPPKPVTPSNVISVPPVAKSVPPLAPSSTPVSAVAPSAQALPAGQPRPTKV